jgi:hypothetical protein
MRKLLIVAILFATSYSAQAASQKFSGILKQDEDGMLYITMRPEGICIIDETEHRKVLAVCKIGGRCKVTGVAGPCEDGECSNMFKVQSVSK